MKSNLGFYEIICVCVLENNRIDNHDTLFLFSFFFLVLISTSAHVV